jgi:DNA-binding CsgD family transcriptional regulator
MKGSTGDILRWPSRNFLGELHPRLGEPHAIEELAARSPPLRRLYRHLRRLSVALRRRLPHRDWIRYADVRAAIQTTEFQLAFNLGFEHGTIATRAESLRGGRQDHGQLATDLRAALAVLPIRSEALVPTLLELAWAIARGAPIPRERQASKTSDVVKPSGGSEDGTALDVAGEFSLTRRESEVLRAAVRGLSTKAIAGEIGISAKAVEYYWRRIFAKLGCHAQIEVMALLLRRACQTNRRRSPSKR